MHEALIIFKDKVTLKEIIKLFEGILEISHVNDKMISHDDKNLDHFISFDLDTYALDIYKEEGIMLFPNPIIYVVHFKDFDLFKKCISHIGEMHEIIVDNDHGRLIRNYRDILSIRDYGHFIAE